MKFLILLICCCAFSPANSQNLPLGIFNKSADIGDPKNTGSARYDEATQTYYLKGSGYNIWFNRDEFQYLYRKINGDFILTAHFQFLGVEGNGHRKIGWMIRENLDEGAASYNAVTHGDGLTVLQWRPIRGAYMRDPEEEIFFPKKIVYQTIQLERIGHTITMSVANCGEPLQIVGATEMYSMKDSVYVGLFISSHDSDKVEEAKMWNVRIDKPVENKYYPNPNIKATAFTGTLGCRLETMNVFDGVRKVIHESTGKFEAPNWMPGGKRLLYNDNGYMYTIPVDGGAPEKLNTGTLSNINNDHGISFDGKMLAISSKTADLPGGESAVYVVPLSGGNPKLVTTQTPSYWHGWAPDGKSVAVVAQRNGLKIYNLYKVDINTGKETALTNNKAGHVDGPEYSPDGKYIYYNANPTGTMQIWRMKPDGTANGSFIFRFQMI
jgi:TolB protein